MKVRIILPGPKNNEVELTDRDVPKGRPIIKTLPAGTKLEIYEEEREDNE